MRRCLSPSPMRSTKYASCARIGVCALRGPAAILLISRDTCSDSIANFFVLVFMRYGTVIARYVAKWGIALMCLCKIRYQGGGSHNFGGVLTSLKKYRAIWGSIAVSRYMGPLSMRAHTH